MAFPRPRAPLHRRAYGRAAAATLTAPKVLPDLVPLIDTGDPCMSEQQTTACAACRFLLLPLTPFRLANPSSNIIWSSATT